MSIPANLLYVNTVAGMLLFCEFKRYINDDSFRICPFCNKENRISLMPLQKNEAYRISLEDKRGLEIQFLKLKTLGDNL